MHVCMCLYRVAGLWYGDQLAVRYLFFFNESVDMTKAANTLTVECLLSDTSRAYSAPEVARNRQFFLPFYGQAVSSNVGTVPT